MFIERQVNRKVVDKIQLKWLRCADDLIHMVEDYQENEDVTDPAIDGAKA